MTRRSTYPLFALLLVAGIVVTAVVLINQSAGAIDLLPTLNALFGRPQRTATVRFDYDEAAANAAIRWQAMAHYYAEHGLLTRDDFDYAQAADVSAARWQAMARYYADHDRLTRVDSARAADLSAARWQAMARFYEQQGLLTRDDFDYAQAADQMAFRWQAMARFYERQGLLNEAAVR